MCLKLGAGGRHRSTPSRPTRPSRPSHPWVSSGQYVQGKLWPNSTRIDSIDLGPKAVWGH
eukprot:6186772-Pleurochrysis_carterae.AAC.1